MVSWRCIAGGSTGTGRFLIWYLQGDGRIAPEASPKSALGQQMMQLDERRYRHAWRADLHAGARDRIQQPGCNHDDHARRHLEMDKVPRGALLAPDQPDRVPMKRMPAIMDLDVLPDMGRITL
jgi:hypothetical protein